MIESGEPGVDREHVVGRRRHRAGSVRVGLRGEQGRDQLLHRVARAPVARQRHERCEPRCSIRPAGCSTPACGPRNATGRPSSPREQEHTPGPVLTFAEFRERLAAAGHERRRRRPLRARPFRGRGGQGGKLRHRPQPRRRGPALARARRRDREGHTPAASQPLA